MKRLAFASVAMLVGLAACQQGASNATNTAGNSATNAATAASTGSNYELDIVRGSAQYSAVVLRINAATGQTTLSSGGAAFIHVAEPTPPPAGVYHLTHFATLDTGATTREWQVFRLDASSGRVWNLSFDGQSTASWVEVTGAP